MQFVSAKGSKDHICPHLEKALVLLGKKWNAKIITVLLEHGPLRFKQLSKFVDPCSDRVLVERLKELEGAGLVERMTFPSSSLIKYRLTKMGADLNQTLKSLHSWSDKWLCKDESMPSN
ncbi:winged helix-turn-helix transcriptional regulator [Xylocopilactobacillus apicola]|uniref:MarR family transcriptional regulator n=1 Tax=Xylocopilactobacillus apicola TaxID=2932184 RepID=A0AAU9DWR4_9LACO|nr:helix-turn-helix domain-containing protein [Xylocopilactobacillus apicola]BDR58473.1 MarR family transcriptional regulator [Xylocopilactobacillus apicola]